MASRTVSVCKFVGTVSLGLLTGLSYTLSTVTVPTLFTLPSASSAQRAFASVATTARAQLRVLAAVSGSAFALAFLLSPRAHRHPYLIYTSLLVAASRLATSELLAPYLFLAPRQPAASSSKSPSPSSQQARRERAARAPMEASYEVLGSGSDAHSEGSEEAEDQQGNTNGPEDVNGEEVRGEVEGFLRKQVVQTAVSGLAFLMAVVGIWGDGAMQVFSSETFVIEV